MKVFHTTAEFRTWRGTLPAGAALPFVPTMGALHAGHASLVRQARAVAGPVTDDGLVLSSIFVNPTQFGPNEDFAKYPRTLDSDLALLREAGCDAVFVPSTEEMYGDEQSKIENGKSKITTVDPGDLGTVLEGAIRPGHFRGVCTVVLKLLNIVQPTHLLLGQKDFQQQVILRRMCAELKVPVEVVTCSTVREPDGLALSSRNRYLSAEERSRAPAIYESLMAAKAAFDAGERRAAAIEQSLKAHIEKRGLAVQYAVAAEPQTLRRWADIGPGEIAGACVLLVAAKLGATRLIDNMIVAETPG